MENINSLNSIINKKGKGFTIDNFKSNETILKKERLTRSFEVEELQQISEIQQKKIKRKKSKRKEDHNDDGDQLKNKNINKNFNETERLKLSENIQTENCHENQDQSPYSRRAPWIYR